MDKIKMSSESRIAHLNEVLASLKIPADCVAYNNNRHFSYYDLELKPGCRVKKIHNLSSEIALAVKSRTEPIIKTIPEKGIVRLQMIHDEPEIIPLSEIMETPPTKAGLPFLFGMTEEASSLWVNMVDNPHLLVAGATNSGKSVTLHTIIKNALDKSNVDIYLVDTKKVEFQVYTNPKIRNRIHKVANSQTSAIATLSFLCDMMEQRYETMAQLNYVNIEQCSTLFNRTLVVMDEVADLMVNDKQKVFENYVVRLAQKGRACGIYLVLATQRPSVNVLTGLIKANFPARMACRVATGIDSKVILDQTGAQNLIGKGDALFLSPEQDLVRLQVAFTNPEDTVKDYLARV